jgi:nicotinamidase-related amidase
LHGNAPDKSEIGLLLIDVINDFEFEDGDALFAFAFPMADRILALKRRAKESAVPIIYVNDNFGHWKSDFRAQVRHCLDDDVRGRPIAQRLIPEEDDYFILKPKHSGFFSTTLELLLVHLQVRTVILTGVAADNCVLFTANDAYLREFEIVVPSDCVASNTAEDTKYALAQMRKVLKADTRPSRELDFDVLRKRAGRRESLSPRPHGS